MFILSICSKDTSEFESTLLEGIIYSPVDGVIEMIFNTKHAIGIKSNNNLEILIHLGIDTVKLNGEGFEVFVSEKQKIKAGDKLMSMDLDFIKNNAKSDISPIIFTNLEENTTINFTPKNIKAKENNIIEIRKNEN